ncbi:BA75_00355T0 [Komagataella pastoris]|uniref:Sulfhydryl oxidase n=1 Tax=Komagataella pastoris TaxID=4922 RepID=A0A1B2J698_PICPA|nr:BA75_00355T0 [Komagataella pastoris]
MIKFNKRVATLTATLLSFIVLYTLFNSGARFANQLDQPVPLKTPELIIPNQSTKNDAPLPFMPKMANETLKAELGNASWKLFHTILARYPESPSENQKSTLNDYIYLFAQVYPCGDCARHFNLLLQKYPPQLSSRQVAAVWGCHIHNQVNKRLEKPQYDCSNILEDYDCGCGSDEKEVDDTLNNETMEHLQSIKITEKENEQFGR